MNRPVGVTVIAVLCFIGAAFCLLGGVLFMLGGGFMATILSQSGQANAAGAGILAGLGAAVVGAVILIFGVVYALVGWGLWQLKGWARIVTIVLSAIGALLQLPGLFAGLTHFNPVSLFFAVVFLVFYAWAIWYLLQPNVSAAFQGGQARTASA